MAVVLREQPPPTPGLVEQVFGAYRLPTPSTLRCRSPTAAWGRGSWPCSAAPAGGTAVSLLAYLRAPGCAAALADRLRPTSAPPWRDRTTERGARGGGASRPISRWMRIDSCATQPGPRRCWSGSPPGSNACSGAPSPAPRRSWRAPGSMIRAPSAAGHAALTGCAPWCRRKPAVELDARPVHDSLDELAVHVRRAAQPGRVQVGLAGWTCGFTATWPCSSAASRVSPRQLPRRVPARPRRPGASRRRANSCLYPTTSTVERYLFYVYARAERQLVLSTRTSDEGSPPRGRSSSTTCWRICRRRVARAHAQPGRP